MRRLAALPAETRAALLRVAALARPTVELVDVEALAPAEEAGLVRVGLHGRVEFTHPLFASAVYTLGSECAAARGPRRAGGDGRRSRGAGAPPRAGLATARTKQVAQALEEAGRSARRRGAPDVAAHLTELALKLAPEDDPRAAERRLELAEHLHLAGDFQRAGRPARCVGARAAARRPPRPRLAAAGRDRLLASGRVGGDPPRRASGRRGHGALPAGALPRVRRHVGRHGRRAEGGRGGPRFARAAGRRTTRIPRCSRWPSARACGPTSSSATAWTWRPPSGRSRPSSPARRRRRSTPGWCSSSGSGCATSTTSTGRGCAWSEAERQAREEGDESSFANILLNRTLLECWAGDWPAALELADRTHETFQLTGVQVEAQALARLRRGAPGPGRLGARGGRGADGGSRADRADALGAVARARRARGRRARGWPTSTFAPRWTCSSRWAGASRRSGVSRATRSRPRSASATRSAPPCSSTASSSRRAARGIPWSLAVSARCRGLLLAAQGQLDAAAEALERALRRARAQPGSLRAREDAARLRAGARAGPSRSGRPGRRSRRRPRSSSELGAEPWAARTHEELRRTAARAAPTGLSETELKIARLAADGLTNRAIAAEVFVSPQDGRGEPRTRLPQARDPLPRPARPRARGGGAPADFVGVSPFRRGAAAPSVGAMVEAPTVGLVGECYWPGVVESDLQGARRAPARLDGRPAAPRRARSLPGLDPAAGRRGRPLPVRGNSRRRPRGRGAVAGSVRAHPREHDHPGGCAGRKGNRCLGS